MKLIILLFVLISVIRPENMGKTSIVIPSVFSDNMVLQQNSQVPFWGKAKPGESITVNCTWGASANTTADDE
jgi:hypothetical protein